VATLPRRTGGHLEPKITPEIALSVMNSPPFATIGTFRRR